MARIPLRARDRSIRAYAIVDDEDFWRLNRHTWCFGADGYAMRNIKIAGRLQTILMAREIMKLQPGDKRQVDHIDRTKKLDNRRSNLRVVTQGQNKQNVASRRTYKGKPPTSSLRGVSWRKDVGKWIAFVVLDKKQTHLGYFKDEEEAGKAAAAARLALMPFTIETKERVEMRTYKIRSFRNGRNSSGEDFINYSVTIPTPIAQKILDEMPDGVEFECELTNEGLLYRPVEPKEEVPANLPFKRGKRSANGKTAPAKPAAKKTGRAKPAAPVAKGKAPRPAAKAKPAAKTTARAKPAAPKGKATTVRAKPGAKTKTTTAAVRKPTAATKPRAPRPAAAK